MSDSKYKKYGIKNTSGLWWSGSLFGHKTTMETYFWEQIPTWDLETNIGEQMVIINNGDPPDWTWETEDGQEAASCYQI